MSLAYKPCCPSCYADEPDALLCKRCTRRLEHDLRQLPGWLRELDTTLAKDTGKSETIGGRSADTALPYNPHATKVGSYVRNQLMSWVQELDAGDTKGLADNPRAWCHWLLRHIDRIRMHPAVDELVGEIDYCTKLILRAVDQHDDRVAVGPCEVCGHQLKAQPTAETVVCHRCKESGVETVVSVLQRRRALLAQAEARLLPRAEILRAVPSVYGVEINSSTFRSWIHRGRLTPVEVTPAGVPLYRMGDVLNLVQAGDVDTRASA